MAQERHEMTSADETAQIKSEIERTRVEMSETLGEIQDRLRPDHLIQQAKDTVTVAATGKVRTMMHSAGETATRVADQTRYAGRSAADYALTHPVQMALLAGGATWWLLRGRGHRFDTGQGFNSELDTDYATEYESDYAYGEGQSMRDKAGEYVASARETVGEYASTARETVGEYASTARETVGEYAGAARERARRARERVRDAAGTASVRARETWNRTSTTVDDWVHQNPMAAGALAIAIGAAIGLSAPRSRFEDRTFGERRDQAMERARAKARELKDTVTERAKNVADTVNDLTAPKGSTTTTGTSSGVGVSGTSSTTGSV